MPGDALALPGNSTFFGLVQELEQPRCATGLEVTGTGGLDDYLALLDSLTFTSSPRGQPMSADMLRVIRVELEGLATLYTAVKVMPAENAAPQYPAGSPSPWEAGLPEGQPPDFAVAVMQQCASPLTMSVHGVPTLCLSDPDAPLFRAEAHVDAYAGSTYGPLALQPASEYTMNFSAYVMTPRCSSGGGWSAVPLGAPLFDCSSLPPAGGVVTQPTACLWQRFRVVLEQQLPFRGGAFRTAATSPPLACEPGCALNFNSTCPSASSTPFPSRGMTFSATLVVTDTPLASSGLIANTSDEISLHLSLQKSTLTYPALAWPDAGAMSTLGYASPLAPGAAISIDDLTGKVSSASLPRLLFCSQSSGTSTALLSALPLEGPGLLLTPPSFSNATPVSSLFVIEPLRKMQVWLDAVPPCLASLLASSPLHLSTNGTFPMRAWAHVTPLKFSAASPNQLPRLAARTVSLLVQPSPESPLAQAVPITVRLTRANRNVSWAAQQPPLLIQYPGSTTQTEVLTVEDPDAEQDVSVQILSTRLTSCLEAGSSVSRTPSTTLSLPPGVLLAIPLPNSTSVTDFATGRVSLVNATRGFRLGLSSDGLSLVAAARACGIAPASASNCTFAVTLLAQDSGDPTPSHSLLPLQPPTSATAVFYLTIGVVFNLTIGAALNRAASITSILGVPPRGLSVGGGDVLEFRGIGLGLRASVLNATFYNGEAAFPLANCTNVEILHCMRCTTTPGFGPAVTRLDVWVDGEFFNFTPPSLTLPSFMVPRVAAVLPASKREALWHATLPPVGPPNASLDLPSLLAASPNLTFAPPPSNLTVLIEGAPGSALLSMRGLTVTMWAHLVLEGGAFLPLGSCSPSSFAAPSTTDFYASLSPTHALPLALPSALSSSSWWDCPFPALSAGHFRRFEVSAAYAFNSSSPFAAVAPFQSLGLGHDPSNPLPVFPGATNASLLVGLPSPLIAAAAMASRGPLVVPSREPPSIVSVTQSSPGGAFQVLGANLGSAHLAWHSDRVEYRAQTCGGGLLLASCATHRGRACRYTSANHSSVSCEMEVGGWGVGFAVRVVVGGQTSSWSTATISYAPPVLRSAVTFSLLGGNASSLAPSTAGAAVLEPSGGGLLALRGQNLFPPHALVVYVGGVRVYPLNARPLQQLVANLSLLQCAPNNPSSLGCFGDHSSAWHAQQGSSAGNSMESVVVVTYPPGLGNVSVQAYLGGASSPPLSLTYGAPVLTRPLASRPSSNTTYTIILSCARLSPCAHCLDTTNAYASTSAACSALKGSFTSASFAASLFPAPLTDSGEGALPGPLSLSNLTLSSCALPDAVWRWDGSRSAPANYARVVTSAITASISLPSSQSYPGKSVFGAIQGTDVLYVLDASAPSSDPVPMQLLYSSPWAALASSNNLTISNASFIAPVPEVDFITPSQGWYTSPGNSPNNTFSLSVANTGPLGAACIYPITPPGIKNSQSSWAGGPIPCPMTPSTMLLLTDPEGNSLMLTAAEWMLKAPPEDVSGSIYLNVWNAAPFWAVSPGPLPCSILSWQGASSDDSISLSGLSVTITQPAWLGAVRVEIFSKGSLSSTANSARSTAAYAEPSIISIAPITGSSPGGYHALLSGSSLGLGPSLGHIWSLTGCAALVQSIRLTSELPPEHPWMSAPQGWPGVPVPLGAFPHSLFFAYSVGGSSSAVSLRRTAPLLAWGDRAVSFSAPEGIAGSTNVPTLSLNYAWLGERNETLVSNAQGALFTYDPPNVTSVEWVDSEATSVRIRIRGQGLSRFTPVVGSVDPAEGGKWRYAIVAQGAGVGTFTQRGLVKGGVEATVITQDLTSQAYFNDAIIFDAPQVLEGSVGFSIQLLCVGSTNPPATPPVFLAARPPQLLAIDVVPATPSDPQEDFNPCRDLTAPPSASPSRACLTSALALYRPPLGALGTSSRGQPCFRVTPSPLYGGTVLRLRGRFFGSGRWVGMGIYLHYRGAAANISLPLLTQSGDAWRPQARPGSAPVLVPCNVIQNRTTWGNTSSSESQVYCALSSIAGVLPRGPTELYFGVAFTRVSASAGGLGLVGACPCGSFSERDGEPCVPCNERALCHGGLEKPFARAGVWETKASEWEERWLTEKAPGALLSPPVPRWVPCATPSECLPNNTCTPGSQGFMCSTCFVTPRLYYARGSKGACELCSPIKSLALVLSLALGIPLLAASALATLWCCSHTECCRAARQGAVGFLGRVRAAACGGAAALSSRLCCRPLFRPLPPLKSAEKKEPTPKAEGGKEEEAGARIPPPSLLALLRILVTFCQTCGALSLFTSRLRGRPPDTRDGLIIPTLLKQLQVFLDMGLSLSEFSCAASFSFPEKLLFTIAVPVICVALVPPAVWVARHALNAARSLLHTCCSRVLGLSPLVNVPAALTADPSMVSLTLLFFVLPAVISSLALSQDCASAAEGGFLYADPSVSCEAPDTKALTSQARLWAYALTFATPSAIFLWCSNSLPHWEIFNPLTRGYHSQTYVGKYWECFTLVRKTMVLGLATGMLWFKDPRSQVIASTFFLAISLVLHLTVWPFGHERKSFSALNWLDTLSLAGTVALSMAVVARLQSSMGVDLPMPVSEQNNLDFLALLFIMPFLLVWLFLFIDSLLCEGSMAESVSEQLKRWRAFALGWYHWAFQHWIAKTNAAEVASLQKFNAVKAANDRKRAQEQLASRRSSRLILAPAPPADAGYDDSGSSFPPPMLSNPMHLQLQHLRAASQRFLGGSSRGLSAEQRSLLAKQRYAAAASAELPRLVPPTPKYFTAPPRCIDPFPLAARAPVAATAAAAAAASSTDAPEKSAFDPTSPRGSSGGEGAPVGGEVLPPRPVRRSPSDIARGLWRLRGAVWVQDGTGDECSDPPIGAAVPGGWVVVQDPLSEREGCYGFFSRALFESKSGAAFRATATAEMRWAPPQPQQEGEAEAEAEADGEGEGEASVVVLNCEPPGCVLPAEAGEARLAVRSAQAHQGQEGGGEEGEALLFHSNPLFAATAPAPAPAPTTHASPPPPSFVQRVDSMDRVYFTPEGDKRTRLTHAPPGATVRQSRGGRRSRSGGSRRSRGEWAPLSGDPSGVGGGAQEEAGEEAVSSTLNPIMGREGGERRSSAPTSFPPSSRGAAFLMQNPMRPPPHSGAAASGAHPPSQQQRQCALM